MFKYSFLFLFCTISLFGSESFYYQNGGKIQLIKLTDGDILTTHYYKTPKGGIVGVGDEIIIRLKNDIPIETFFPKYNFVVLEKISEKTYLVKVQSNLQTLDIANLLFLEDDVESSQPNFIKIINKR